MSEIFNGCLDNRELSWLKFNERVLEEAEDVSLPLMERLNFVSIFCSNSDEFFMVRVGTLHDQTLVKETKKDNKSNLTPSQQLEKIALRTAKLLPRKEKAYKDIIKKLKEQGIEQVSPSKPRDKKEEEFLEKHFKKEILPLLFPTVVDKNHPMPFLKNRELYAGLYLKPHNGEKNTFFGILPLTAPDVFERIIYLPSEEGKIRFLLTEELIMHFIGLVFPDFDVQSSFMFRITRNADIDVNEALYDHDVDFRDVMEELIKKRKKLAPVRIELLSKNGKIDKTALTKRLGLDLGENFVFEQRCPLDLSFIGDLRDKIEDKTELFFSKLTPQPPLMLEEGVSVMKQAEREDILLFYPYERFESFISLLDEASVDPSVVSIKITLYRVARDSKVVNALIRAAERGKDVLALVELRARFDEENNIGWSKRLSDAGVKVIYGLESLKVHSKLLLITRRAENEIQYITQIGTGNYNERTSKLYTDLTLITSDKEFGADASLVFNSLSHGIPVESSSTLLVAPNCLKSRVVELIDREITYGSDGYIGIKMNSLTDIDIIQKLIEASKKGVKIQLIIRGICCLTAGVEGYTENITVSSIVGRFLEHSRIYIFGKNERRRLFISSADFMTRNTEKRVEVAAPIKSPFIQERLIDIFNTMLKDNVKARIQLPDGTYRKKELKEGELPFDSQLYFYEQAYKNQAIKEAAREEKLKTGQQTVKIDNNDNKDNNNNNNNNISDNNSNDKNDKKILGKIRDLFKK